MHSSIRYTTARATLLAAALILVANIVPASTESDERSLDRGAVADFTPHQRYRSAIREAGGAYKENQRDCAAAGPADRAACLRDAKAMYDRDMAAAKALLTP